VIGIDRGSNIPRVKVDRWDEGRGEDNIPPVRRNEQPGGYEDRKYHLLNDEKKALGPAGLLSFGFSLPDETNSVASRAVEVGYR